MELLYNLALLVSMIILIFLISYILVKSDNKKKVWYIAALVCAFMFLLGDLLGKTSLTAEGAFLSTKIEYLGSAPLTTAVLLFVADFCGVKIRRVYKCLLWAVPFAVILLLWTNEYHGLIYEAFDLADTSVQYLQITPGPLYLVTHIYSLLTSLAAFILLTHRFAKGGWGTMRRINIFLLIVGVLIPIAANVLYAVGVISFYATPLLVSVSSVIFFFNTIKFDMLDVEIINLRLKTEKQHRTILESVSYASKIQRNMLPVEAAMKRAFSDHSVIWKPRDVVGGDVYWMKQFDNGTVLCVCDCTGHSMPGALLTMLVTSALESIVWEVNCDNTADIVWQLDQRLSAILHVDSATGAKHEIMDISDGCDIAVLFAAKDGSVCFSSGNTPVFICNGAEIVHHRGQKLFVGEGKLKSENDVKIYSIPYSPDNKIYVASDGLFDQIGGEHRKQFGYEFFKQIILEHHDKKLSEINSKVWETYEEYRGSESRRDDFELISFVPKRIAGIKTGVNFSGVKAEDLFASEQSIFESAAAYVKELRGGASPDINELNKLVNEYGRLLRQLRRATKVSDRATAGLSTSKTDLQVKVNFDALTGLYNRRYLDDNIGRVVRSAARTGSILSVMMLDIDYFKKYNDTYGHSEGDECLKAVASAIAECVSRPDDFAVRYGGEEFAVILPNTDENGARFMANKILEAVRALGIPHEKNEAASYVTVSIGVTSRKVLHDHTGDDFIKRADAALYGSKENGRNRYTYLEWNI